MVGHGYARSVRTVDHGGPLSVDPWPTMVDYGQPLLTMFGERPIDNDGNRYRWKGTDKLELISKSNV